MWSHVYRFPVYFLVGFTVEVINGTRHTYAPQSIVLFCCWTDLKLTRREFTVMAYTVHRGVDSSYQVSSCIVLVVSQFYSTGFSEKERNRQNPHKISHILLWVLTTLQTSTSEYCDEWPLLGNGLVKIFPESRFQQWSEDHIGLRGRILQADAHLGSWQCSHAQNVFRFTSKWNNIKLTHSLAINCDCSIQISH
jgi:hypothetical protein